MNNNTEPFIPASQNLPEITLKGIILAILLAALLGATNAYLGLKIGLTLSASIPAAVISMGILSLFKKSNILENNIVQTAASSGEGMAAGVIFILPALIILHYWQHFNYWETTLLAMTGGVLGVFFSVLLRRILIGDRTLRFPEGVAIAQVLKAANKKAGDLKHLVMGGAIGGTITLAQTGFEIIADSMPAWFKTSNVIYGMQIGFEPALIGAGYIIGINVGISILLGLFIGWGCGIPILSYLHGFPATDSAAHAAIHVWQSQTRYIGVGVMMLGGFWTLLTLVNPIRHGLQASFSSIKKMRQDGGFNSIIRTERDIPIHYVLFGIAVLLIPITYFLYHFLSNANLPFIHTSMWLPLLVCFIFVPIAGFVFSSLCGYFAGLVGSSCNPLSSLALSALLLASLILILLFGLQAQHIVGDTQRLAAAACAVLITTIVTCAAAITNDTIQDLKTGQLVGATPWKQQLMLILGTIVAALIIAPVLELLFNAYGIGDVMPRAGMNPAQALAAPQAMLMATIAQGVFTHNLPWTMIFIGFVIAAVCIVADRYLKTRGQSLPVLAVGFGIYLPASVSVAMGAGAILSWLVKRNLEKRNLPEAEHGTREQRGLVIACGLIAGASLMGVLLAIPFTIMLSTDALKLVGDSFTPIANTLGFVAVFGLLYWIYHATCKHK